MSSQAWRIVERKEEEIRRLEDRIRRLEKVAYASYATIRNVIGDSKPELLNQLAFMNIVALQEAGYDMSKTGFAKGGT